MNILFVNAKNNMLKFIEKQTTEHIECMNKWIGQYGKWICPLEVVITLKYYGEVIGSPQDTDFFHCVFAFIIKS